MAIHKLNDRSLKNAAPGKYENGGGFDMVWTYVVRRVVTDLTTITSGADFGLLGA